MITTTCQFSDPVELGEGDLEYSQINCNSENDVYILVENSTTGASFYVEKTLNYGDAILIWFATLFIFYLIFKVTYNFFWKK